ncbi:choice-of-anchor tandem repeat GloVer-containing protein [Cupriavidus sp. 30B13]|uniref:choice-of-anchor tandem repeat GloVer-containing protein n=1 Tax=Cupriavidus sp. 30B13 TaxID=3384241 RepID=UPI003B91593B
MRRQSVARHTSPALCAIACALCAAAAAPAAMAAGFAPEVLARFAGAAGQPVGNAPFAPPLYGSDGKLYGTTQDGMPRIGSGGYLFQGVAYVLDPATRAYGALPLGDFGWAYGNLVQRPDGKIYGRTSASLVEAQHYASVLFGVGALLRLDGGVPTPIAPRGADQQPFYDSTFQARGQAAVDGEGRVYFSGAATGVWRMNADESVERIVNFRLPAYLKVVVTGGRSKTYYTRGDGLAAAVWSTADNALYGVTASTGGTGGDPDLVPSTDVPAGTLFRIRAADMRGDGTSTIEVLHTFAGTRDGYAYASDTYQTGLVEDGEWLYGTSLYNGTTTNPLKDGGAVWRLRKGDPASFRVIHRFRADAALDGTAQGGGANPWGTLVRAADGNIYGTTSRDATRINTLPASTAGTVAIGAGTVFRIKVGAAADRADDAVEVLHRFDVARDGARPVGLSAGPVAGGVQKLYGATRAGGGGADALDGSDLVPGYGTVFSIDVPVPSAVLGSLTASAASLAAGGRVTLSWRSENATVCNASGAWSGSKAASGSEQVTVGQGENVYTLACTGADGTPGAARSVTVTGTAGGADTGSGGGPAAGGSSEGGGPLAPAVLAALGLAALWRRRARA